MAVIETWYNQDLSVPVQVQYIHGNVFSQDNNGNLIGVILYKDGQPATISGAVSASVIRADGTTVAVSGSLSGNQCYVVLPQACYAIPGVLSIVVKLTKDSAVTTIAAIVANVYQSATDAVVDPGQLIPSIQSLINAIQATVDYVPSDFSFLSTTIRNTNSLYAPPCEIGTIDTTTGQNASSAIRVRSIGYIPAGVLFVASSEIKIIVVFYDANFNRIGAGSWQTLASGGIYYPKYTGAEYIRFVISYTNDSAVSSTVDLTEKISIIDAVILKNGDDLNNCKAPGLYISESTTVTASLLHCPIKQGAFTMRVEPVAVSGIRQTINQYTSTSPTLIRQYGSTVGFYNWQKVSTKNELTVMSYNICRYNFDQGGTGFPEDIMNEKIENLKKMFMKNAPDLIGIQEDTYYIDEEHTIESIPALFTPVWQPTGSGWRTIRSKLTRVDGSAAYADFDGNVNIGYRRAVYYYEQSKKILFISLHAMYGNDAEADALRLGEYEQIFQHINDSADEWDYCIVTGDFNSVSQTSKDKLVELCNDNGFSMAIGSYMPWIFTHFNKQGVASDSFDNILVSSNIDILTTEVLTDQYPLLYSDHVPVVARLRLN